MTSGATTPRRVVIYSHTGEIGGAEIVLLTLLAGLDRTLYAPVVVCPPGALAERVQHLGIEQHHTSGVSVSLNGSLLHKLRGTLGAALMLRSLRRQLRSLRPALVHANSIRAGLSATLAISGSGIPVLWYLHDILPNGKLSGIIRSIAKWSHSTCLVAVSDATAKAFLGNQGSSSGKAVRVIYNSVDSDAYCPNSSARMKVRAQLGLSDTNVVFACVAQLTARKRQVELIQAFHATRDRMPSAHLVIAGSAGFTAANHAYAKRIDHLVRSLNDSRIHLVGQCSNVAELLAGMDVAVQFPLHEPFGLSLIEAMSVGLPVVCCAVDGTVEVVQDGVTGMLVRSDDVDAMMQKMQVLADDKKLREAMGAAGRADVQERFSPQQQLLGVQDLYRDIVDRSGAAS